MPTVTGNPVEVTLQKAQYLFRVYHSPITSVSYPYFKGMMQENGDPQSFGAFGREPLHNDHLLSVPMTDSEIIDAANRLVYAEAVLYVDSQIWFVVVWLVEEGKPINKESPVVVLTHWKSREFSSNDQEYVTNHNNLAEPRCLPPSTYVSNWALQDLGLQGFQSYNLTPIEGDNSITDPFMVLDVARQTDGGRMRHQWFKGVLTPQDFYFDKNGHLNLVPFGSACLTRFPWFQSILETMNYTHSGWTLNADGSITEGNVALTERIANLAVDAAQQRRMFFFRNPTLIRVYEAWWRTVTLVGYYVNSIEMGGWPEYYNVKNFMGEPDARFPYAWCQTLLTYHLINIVQWFVNVLAVASGSNVLATFMPFETAITQQAYYETIVNYLNGGTYNGVPIFEPVAEYEESISYTSIGGIQDLLGVVIQRLNDYFRSGLFNPDGSYRFNIPMNDLEAYRLVAVHNNWASQYQSTQGHCQAMLSLLFTWQFQYKPVEKKRNSAASDFYKTHHKTEKEYSQHGKHYQTLSDTTKAARLEGRINEEIPIFAPPRSWSVTIPLPNAQELHDQAQAAYERQLYAEKLAAAEARKAAIKAARAARHEAEMDALIEEIEGPNGANPNDIYDNRNWRRKKFWLTPIHEDDVVEFTANALNVPDEVTVAEEVFHLNPKIVNARKRLEPAISAVRNVAYPHLIVRNAIKSTLIKRTVKEAGKNYLTQAEDEVKSDGQSRVLKEFGAENPEFEPRQFWPQDEPPVDENGNPPSTWKSGENDFGGGESGGGGAERPY